MNVLNIVIIFAVLIRVSQIVSSRNISQKYGFIIYLLALQLTIEVNLIYAYYFEKFNHAKVSEMFMLAIFTFFCGYAFSILIRHFPIKGLNNSKLKTNNTYIIISFLILLLVPFVLFRVFNLPLIKSFFLISIIELIILLFNFFKLKEFIVQYKVTSIIQFGLVMVFLLLNIYIFFYNYFTIGDIAFSPGDSIENLLLLNLSRSILLLFASFSAFVIITKVEEVFWRKYSYIISLVYTVLSLFIIISINLNHNLKVVEINNDFGIDIDLLSELIDTTKLEELNGEVVDRTKSEYLLIKKQLQSFIDRTASYKYIYIYGLNERNEVVAFIEVSASSYASEAKDFLPGDIYNEPSDEMLDSLTMQKSNNEGPIRDEFGLWYSHFAPLKVNGERLMIVGADMSADDFESKIYNDQVIILAFILFISFIVFISDDTTSLNFTKIEIYSLAINRFKLLFGLYADPVLIIENDIIIDCNSEAVKFFNYRKVKIIGMDFINLAASNESSKKELLTLFDSYLETIKKGENEIFEWTFIINKKEKFAEITLTKFVDAKYKGYQILIHDISDRKKKEDETKKEINELEKLNKIMIGRELKMIELKKEIRDLKNTFKGNL